jgi:hypothetical protein
MEKLVVSLDFLEFPVVNTCDGGNQSPRLVLNGLQAAISCRNGIQSIREILLLIYAVDYLEYPSSAGNP